MSGDRELVVSGIGAITPVGAGAAQTCASIRAGLSGLRRHPSYTPMPPSPIVEPPERISCGLAVADVIENEREPRLLQLGLAAARDLVRSSGLSRTESNRLEITLCLGEAERPGLAPLDRDLFADELPRRLGLALAQPIKTLVEGQTGAYRTISEVGRSIVAGELERAMILCVDSLVSDQTLLWFDQQDRLRSARTLDGFLPGEAATALLLERADRTRARGGKILARVAGAGVGREPNTITGPANSTGQGLCQAIQAAAAGWGDAAAPIDWAICDMTGESYGAYEWGVAVARLGEQLGVAEIWHPADAMGAVGAASAGLALVVAARALEQGYAPADRVLLWCSADGPQRAACALSSSAAAPVDRGAGR